MAQCPVCQNIDQVRKASAIVAEGSHTTHTTGYSTGTAYAQGRPIPMSATHRFQNFSQSGLAAQLSYNAPRPLPLWYAGAGVVFLFLSGLGGTATQLGAYVAILLGALAFFVAFGQRTVKGFLVRTAAIAAFLLLFSYDGFRDLLSYAGICQAAGALLILAVAVQRLVHWLRRHRQARAWDAWNQLYYCFRDDVVFHPVTGRYGPPGAAQSIAQGG